MSRLTHTLTIITILLFTPLFAHAGVTLSKPPVQNNIGLVGHWTFDGPDMPGGRANDVSGNGNHGSLTNIATSTFYTEGKIGQGVDFSGAVGEYVQVADDDIYSFGNGTTDTPFSLSAWVYYDGTPAAYDYWPVISKWNNTSPASAEWSLIAFDTNSIGSGDANALTLQINTSGGTANRIRVEGRTGLSVGVWQHVTATYDGSSTSGGMKIYLNGVQEVTDADVDGTYVAMSNLGATVDIGAVIRSNTTFDAFADGKIDDIRVYSRALAPSEVEGLYNAGQAKVQAVKSNDVTDGLVGHWTFDGADGGGRDQSGNGNHGTLSGTSTSTASVIGKVGQAFQFDGEDDFVDTTARITTTSFTVSMWVKMTTLTNGYFLNQWELGHTRRFIILEDGTDVAFFLGTDVGARFAPTVGKWYHLVLTRDSSNLTTAYVDGAFHGSETLSGSLPGVDLQIGGTDRVGNRYSESVIDDVRVYNRALSAEEIKRIYNSTAGDKVNKTPTKSLSNGLVGHWTFDGPDMPGGRANDVSGNGNHGSLTNIATSTFYTEGKIGQGARFDGVDDYIKKDNFNSSIDGSFDATISAWVYAESWSVQGVVSQRGTGTGSTGWITAIDVTGKMKFYDNGNSQWSDLSTNALSEGRWHHVVWVYDSTNTDIHFYLDGVGNGNDTTIGSNFSPSTTLTISGWDWSSTPSGKFIGKIDDARIYNRALSASEITQLYNLGR